MALGSSRDTCPATRNSAVLTKLNEVCKEPPPLLTIGRHPENRHYGIGFSRWRQLD